MHDPTMSPLRRDANIWFLLALGAFALYLCYLIAEPFLDPIFAAIVLAIIFYPLHALIERRLPNPNLAATITTVLVLVVVAIPAVLLAVAITRELTDLYQLLSQKSAEQGGFSAYAIHSAETGLKMVGIDPARIDIRSTLIGWVEQGSRFLIGLGAKALGNVFSLLLAIVAAFFTLFFLFRDGPKIQHAVVGILPLTDAQSRRLLTGINDTIVASVQGGIAVGVAQGTLTGLGFWVLGLPSPAVAGLLAAIASLIPVVGSGLVWIPAVVVLFLSGQWVKGVVLLAWSSAVVAQIDVLVRPYIISERAKMNNLMIFFALLGGVSAFGIMGLFIGPVVVSVTMTVLSMLREMNLAAKQDASGKPKAAARPE